MKNVIIKWLMNNIDIKKEVFKIYNGKVKLISYNCNSWKMKNDKWNNITISFLSKQRSDRNKRTLKKAYLNGKIQDVIITHS